MDSDNKVILLPVDDISCSQTETLALERDLSPEEFLAGNNRWQTGSNRLYAIVEADSGQAVGMISVSGNTMPLVGYWIARARQGEGLMRDAFALLLAKMKSEGKLGVWGRIHEDNAASLRIFSRYNADVKWDKKPGFIVSSILFHGENSQDGELS